MKSIAADVIYAVRLLRRRPYLTGAILTTVGLAMALATAVGQATLSTLRPYVPVTDVDHLVYVRTTMPKMPAWAGYAQYDDFRRWNSLPDSPFAAIAARINGPLNLGTAHEGLRLQGAFISSAYFQTLGVDALRGDVSRLADNGHVSCAIGYRLWRTVFAGRDDVIGEAIRLNDRTATIQAVLPVAFDAWAQPTDVWVDIQHRALFAPAREIEQRGYFNTTVIARVRPDHTLAQVRDRLQASAQTDARAADGPPGLGVTAVPMRTAETSPEARSSMLLLYGATLLALAVALANALCLLAALATDRQREMAIRQALGASRRTLRRQWMIETIVLFGGAALVGGVGAMVVRRVATGVSGDYARLALPPGSTSDFWSAVATALALVIGLAIVAGLVLTRLAVPAETPERLIRHAATRHAPSTRLQSGLLVGQIGVSTMLTAATVGLLATLFGLQRVDFGFDQTTATRIQYYRVHLPAYEIDTTELPARLNAMRAALASNGHGYVALATDLPIPNAGGTVSITLEGQPTRLNSGAAPTPGRHYVSPDHFRLFGVPLVAGRDFADADSAGRTPVAIVNRKMAELFWPGENPIGKRVKFEFNDDEPWTEIIGLVDNVRYGGPRNPLRPELYSPLAQHPRRDALVLVRTSAQTNRAETEQIAQEIRHAAPGVILAASGRLRDEIASTTRPLRLAAWLVSLFSGLALGLAAGGVYGLAAQHVAHRRYEMAVRMAVGASPGHVLRLVVRDALWRVVLGLTLGLVGMVFLIAPLIRHYLYGVQPESALTIGTSVALLLIAGLLAALGPGLRAARISPEITLRAN